MKRAELLVYGMLISSIFLVHFLFFSVYNFGETVGVSMEPYLHTGNIILYQHEGFDRSNIAVGTVIVYQYNATYIICHRVIIRHNQPGKLVCYEVQGDNCQYSDGVYVHPEDVIGILVYVWR
jgi:signal peptidase I